MHIFSQVVGWIGAHWSGMESVRTHLVEHVLISFGSIAIAIAIAVPIGVLVGHRRKGEFLASSIANIGRAVPSFAALVITFVLMLRFLPHSAFGVAPGVITLALLAIPPILTNTYVGIQTVDRDAVEAARAMGMREIQVIVRLEIPLAIPIIVSGIRTAAVTVVATASLVAVIGGGTLGRFIVLGFARQDNVMAVSGAVLIALLALTTELVLAGVQRALSPRLVSETRRSRPAVEPVA